MTRLLTVGIACILGGAILTALIARLAIRHQLVDLSNERSSHAGAVPRGGGLAIVAVVTGTAIALCVLGCLGRGEALAWIGGGLLVAGVGFMDDRRGLGVGPRLLVQLIAGLAAVIATGNPLVTTPMPELARVAIFALTVFSVIWSINLFNFMDGIDGIAAQQAVFVSGAAVLLAGGPDAGADVWILYTLATACVGFLVWNWAPARIFMGDGGSGYLGFALAVGVLTTSGRTALTIWTWLILHGAFVSDATVTLATRFFRRRRISEPHREHAYQRLARYWGSHARASTAFLAVNLLWLLPLATLTVRRPDLGGRLTVVAWLPLILLAVALGAGRPQELRST
jgi:Fuc2NAc and GlcNAc transferase